MVLFIGIVLLLYIIGEIYLPKPIEVMTWQDFQGVYYLGDGLGINWHLTIKPDQNFILQTSSDLGPTTEVYKGSIVCCCFTP
jgi:hypothetical protein